MPWFRALHRKLLLSVLGLFFFNALLDRLTAYYLGYKLFTTVFYMVIGIALLCRVFVIVRTGRVAGLEVAAALWLFFMLVLGSAYGDVVASLIGIKEFFFGIVFLLLFAAADLPIATLLRSLSLVLLYAIFQGAYFLTQGFTLPPWDAAYVKERLQAGVLNLYQGTIGEGGLIRPFATLGSTVEYGIVVHAFVVGLFLLRSRLSPRQARWTVCLLLLLVVQDALLPERTPILMALLMLCGSRIGFSVVQGLLKGSSRLVSGGLVTAGAVVLPFIVAPFLLASGNPAVKRLGESVEFWRAESVQMRQAHEWANAIQTIRWHPEGMGPGEVVVKKYNPHAQRPHSNYWVLQIGYSWFTVWLFLAFIFVAFRRVFGAALSLDSDDCWVGWCGVAITCAYLAVSFFNEPFSGYSGPPFFLVMLWFDSQLSRPRDSWERRSGTTTSQPTVGF